jgi:RRXRR protein
LAVFVLDKREKPLMRCSEKRPRLLLTRGRAVVHRGYPLTIGLKDRILVPPSIACNQDSKEALSIEELLVHNPKRLAAIQAQLKAPLQDAAAINATRWALYGALKATTGRGFYGRTKLDKYGFPRGHCMRTGSVHGLKAGDMVRAEVPTRKGAHVGRAAVRASGSFSIGKAQHINCKHCRMLQHADEYGVAATASPVASFGRTDLNCRLAPTLAIGRG